MKKLNSLALSCLIICSPLSSFAQKVETEVVKTFDGTTANCEKKSDYIRTLRSGAYTSNMNIDLGRALTSDQIT